VRAFRLLVSYRIHSLFYELSCRQDPKLSGAPEWRKTLDTQRGMLLGTEMKNNSMKLAKFTISVSCCFCVEFGFNCKDFGCRQFEL
jgi:hypothetical protein